MLDHVFLQHVLFLDIETVSAEPDYACLNPTMQALWNKKAAHLDPNMQSSPAMLYARAGIYAEFGKIVCICCGSFTGNRLRIRSFYGDDEAKILQEFGEMMDRDFPKEPFLLCAHNGKEFDFPYIARRMIIHGISLPTLLDMAGKKPWEVRHLDTMELWKFGDWKNYTSLALLTAILGIPSPKEDMDGSEVGLVYWFDQNLKKIVAYCQRDVVAIVQLFLRFQQKPILDTMQIDFSDI